MDKNNNLTVTDSNGATEISPGGEKTKDLGIDTGLVTYRLNGKAEITINPTDGAFFDRILNAFNALEEKQAAYQAQLEQAEPREIFVIARRRDQEMLRLLDEALGTGVCDAVFGGMSVCALADGLPVWANLLLAIIDECDASVITEQKRTNPRLEKYMKKYHERYKK